MSKASNRIVFILGLLGVGLLSGCGVTTTKLPSGLQSGGGGYLSIVTTQFPDAISGRSYYLVISTTGGSGALSSCSVVSGALPAGLSWSVSPTQPSNCILSGSSVGAAGPYSIVMQATDTSSPPKTDQLPYTLTVRSEFSITQTALADAVQGRTYGISPLSQVATTNLSTTAQPQVGQAGEFGNGPITSCSPTTSPFSVAPSNPGLTITAAPAQGQCVLTSTAPLTPAGAYTVTISAMDNPITVTTQPQPVVPANVITKTLNLTVNHPISYSANFDNYSFTPTGAGVPGEVPDAVQSRTYGGLGPYGTASAGGFTSLIFSATGGLLTTQGLTFTPPSTASLPSPVQCGPATGVTYPQVSATTATLVCNSAGALVSASPGTFAFSVTVADAGNTATPGGSTSTDTLGQSSHTLKVNAPLSFSLTQTGNPTPNNPANLLDAVTGRTYGVIGATPTYSPAGGLGANSAGALGNSYYQWCISTGTLPATFSSAGNNLNAACSAQVQSNSETLQATSDISQAVATATAFPFTVQLQDTGNQTTPSATLTNSTILTVEPPLVATLRQNTNPTPTTSLLPGVFNRSYGVVGGGTPTLTAAGGLGGIAAGLGGSYQWCIASGALPTGFVNSGSSLNSPCTSPVVEDTATLSAGAITQNVGSPTAFPFSVRLDDGGNAAVPNGITSGTANVVSSRITVNPQIQLAQSLGTVWPDAVSGRPYGSGANCTGGACAPAIYSATGGLGGYVWPAGAPTGLASITNFACPAVPVGNTTFTCSASNITVAPLTAGTSPISYNPSMAVSDSANAATPAATVSTDPLSTRTDTLWVDAPLLATLTQNGSTNPTSLIPGVSGRSYGTIGAPPTYTATGGLGSRNASTYEWCVDSGSASIPAGLSGITIGGSSVGCSTFGPTGTNTASLTASNISATITPPSQSFPFTVELDDTGNASTPNSVATLSSALQGTTLLLNSALAINLTQSNNGTNPTDLLPAVTNRTYGAIGGIPTYQASYGLGGYVFPASPGPFPGGFACSSTTSNPYTCSATTAVSASPNSYPLSLTVTDTANAAVPSGIATSITNLLVNPQVSVVTNLTPPWPDAVMGRPYGTGAGCNGGSCTPLVYTAEGGLGTVGGYTFPVNTNFFPCTSGSSTLTCYQDFVSQGVGVYHPSVTAVDVANTATPAATTTTDPNSVRPSTDTLVVDPEIVIDNTPNSQLPNGQLGEPYSVLFSCQAPLGTGTCGGTGNPGNAQAIYTWSTVNNTIPGVGSSFPVIPSTLTLTPLQATGAVMLSGTPTSTSGGQTVTVTVTDNGNLTTPSCLAAATCPPNATFSVNILPSYAYVGDVGSLSQQVGVYDTSAGESSIVAQTPISLTGASELRSLTASNNGSQMLVADDMAHHLSILNTLSGGLTVVTSAEGLNNAADDTFDVGVGPQAVPTLGISPDDEYAYVANAGSDNVQVVDANPASATFGHVLSSGGTITFAGGPYLPGARAVKVAPTFNVGTPGTPVRQTHGYVVRDFSQEVCVFDAEPSSATFLTQIAAANSPNADNCINLGLAGAVYPLSLDVSPDGLYAFVAASTGLLEIIDTNPNDTSTFETVIATFNLSGLSTACAQPMGTRVSPDGQTAWVACTDSGQLIGLSTALVNTTQFGLADTLTTPSSGTSRPENVAFRPDGAFGLASLNGTGFVLPFSAVGVGTGLNSSGTPLGIDHVPNAVLHVTTSALPAATNGEAYQSSVVAAGPNGFFTFTDVTPASPGPTLAALGLTLTSYGEIVGTPTTPGNYTFYIQVSDRSQPVNNVVVNAITLTVN